MGYIIFWLIGDEAQINKVAIQPASQGKGYGEQALRYVIERLRESQARLVTLEVRTSNRPAIALYRKLGFNILGIRKDYYSNPAEDAYLMGLNLN
jgi:ribosomal-protein-alanine N-acetyltransferase